PTARRSGAAARPARSARTRGAPWPACASPAAARRARDRRAGRLRRSRALPRLLHAREQRREGPVAAVAAHDRDARAAADARVELVDVGVRESDAAVRPVLPAAAVAVDLDQPPDRRAPRDLATALRRREALAVGGVRVVEQQRAMVDALADVLLPHDPVAAFRGGAVALLALDPEGVRAHLRGVALHGLAARQQDQQVLLLEHQDRRLTRDLRVAARLLDPAAPGRDLLARGVTLGGREGGAERRAQLGLRALCALERERRVSGVEQRPRLLE